MSVVVRFAPSPTGYLHIGGARTALFNYLFAKNQGGKFLLRIEDTDKKRSTSEAITAILQGLEWLGLKNDGDHFLQSQNASRHNEIAKKLLENDQAYLCYTPAEELAEMRQKAQEKNEVFRFQSPWRDKSPSQSSTVKPVVRIKSPANGEMIINDLVQGEVKVQNSELDDFVILRADGSATYMLAVVVDDFDMGVTHIIRGDDHLTNAFRQKVIYEAMQWQVPQFAHIPLIHGADGAKLSKRHGATSVIEYEKLGYLSEAMRNYLLRLGWSHGNDEIISDQQAIQWFNLEKIGKSPSRFDFVKLNSLNKHYIKEKSDEDLFLLMEKWFECQISQQEKDRIVKAIKFLKDRANVMCDLLGASRVYLNDYCGQLEPEHEKLLEEKQQLILSLQKLFADLQDWSRDGVKSALNQFAADNALKIKDFGPLLRVILTFSSSSAGGIFDLIELLGPEEVAKRISGAISAN